MQSTTGSAQTPLRKLSGIIIRKSFSRHRQLGKSFLRNCLFEHDGLVYTSRGGHIDIAHLRIAADNVKSLYNKTRKNLINGNSEFTFKLNVEPSTYHVELEYPEYWPAISPKFREKIADKLALELSQYFTYTMTTWHEVLTWFGFKCVFFLPEKVFSIFLGGYLLESFGHQTRCTGLARIRSTGSMRR